MSALTRATWHNIPEDGILHISTSFNNREIYLAAVTLSLRVSRERNLMFLTAVLIVCIFIALYLTWRICGTLNIDTHVQEISSFVET
jgi:hypothetical protein